MLTFQRKFFKIFLAINVRKFSNFSYCGGESLLKSLGAYPERGQHRLIRKFLKEIFKIKTHSLWIAHRLIKIYTELVDTKINFIENNFIGLE